MKTRRCNLCGVRGVMMDLPSRYHGKCLYYIRCPKCSRTAAPSKSKEEAIVNWWKAVEKRKNTAYEFAELEGTVL